MRSYAVPLFSLISKERFDPDHWMLEALAENLQTYCAQSLGIESLDAAIIQAADEPMLLLKGVEDRCVPKLLALADVQRTQLYEYRRDSESSFSLVPLMVNPG
jgi:hypothetical protein